MIISHQYQFIFIKTHKTAGSSMEMALAPLCGKDDIITPMESNADSDLPRNFHNGRWNGKLYARSRLFRKFFDRHSEWIAPWYYEHMPAARVRQLVGESTWDSYHKFCFERNPWDKVVSYYNWKKIGQGRSLPSFEKWLMKKPHRLPLDARLYFDGTTCMMNEVLDYDGFIGHFVDLCDRLGIPFDGNMPREKTNITNHKVDYKSYYNDATKAKVAELFEREIALKNYTFE